MGDKWQEMNHLNSVKPERVLSAVTPKLGEAMASMAKESCGSMSSLISSLLYED